MVHSEAIPRPHRSTRLGGRHGHPPCVVVVSSPFLTAAAPGSPLRGVRTGCCDFSAPDPGPDRLLHPENHSPRLGNHTDDHRNRSFLNNCCADFSARRTKRRPRPPDRGLALLRPSGALYASQVLPQYERSAGADKAPDRRAGPALARRPSGLFRALVLCSAEAGRAHFSLSLGEHNSRPTAFGATWRLINSPPSHAKGPPKPAGPRVRWSGDQWIRVSRSSRLFLASPKNIRVFSL